MDERQLYLEMRDDPPAPPWVAFPGLEPESIGWRMGGGESHLYRVSVFLTQCTPAEYEAYVKRYPEAAGWSGWYSGEGLIVAGGRLFEKPEERLIWLILSLDQTRLATIGKREDQLLRVRVFHLVTDTWYSGSVWEENAPPTLIDSEVEARQLARDLTSR